MRKTELRIGNWVYRDTHNGTYVFKVEEIRKNKVVCNKDNSPLSSLSPIPLTEEILLKCGFTKMPDIDNCDSYYTVFEKNDIRLLFYLGNFDDCSINGEFYVDISYIHQLQNIYFCLTGEELNIEL